MKKYARVSCSFTPTGAITGLDNDDVVNELVNQKLQEFLKENKCKDYHIINVETVIIPRQDFATTYNRICLHIAYEI